MRKAEIYQQGKLAGILEELDVPGRYRFAYVNGFVGEPVSLAWPIRAVPYEFDQFPAAFEGLLPEGLQLDALLRKFKIDRRDMFQQLLIVGGDVVGSLSVKEVS